MSVAPIQNTATTVASRPILAPISPGIESPRGWTGGTRHPSLTKEKRASERVATYAGGSLRRRQPEQRPQLRCRHFATKLLADRQVKLVRVALGQVSQRGPVAHAASYSSRNSMGSVAGSTAASIARRSSHSAGTSARKAASSSAVMPTGSQTLDRYAMAVGNSGTVEMRSSAPLSGWRRYRCRSGSCRHEREIFGNAALPDFCTACGAPWQSVSETVGDSSSSRGVAVSSSHQAARRGPLGASALSPSDAEHSGRREPDRQ